MSQPFPLLRPAAGLGALLLTLFLAAPAARADGDDAPDPPRTTSGQRMVVVVERDGTKTVRVYRNEDGRWVAVEEDGEAPDASIEIEVVPAPDQGGATPGTRRLRLRADGIAMPDPTPPTPARRAAPDNPVPTILRWLLERQGPAVEGSPFTAWFEREDVPLPGLRDALKADGWTGPALERWVRRHLGAPAPLPARDPAPPCPQCGCRGPGASDGPAEAPPPGPPAPWMRWPGDRPQPPPRGFLLWHDGQTWHGQELPGSAAPPPAPPLPGWGPWQPALPGPWGPPVPPPPPAGSPPAWPVPPQMPAPRVVPEGPARIFGSLEDLPEEVRSRVQEALRGLGIDLEALRGAAGQAGDAWFQGVPSPQGGSPGSTPRPDDCPDCPRRSQDGEAGAGERTGTGR